MWSDFLVFLDCLESKQYALYTLALGEVQKFCKWYFNSQINDIQKDIFRDFEKYSLLLLLLFGGRVCLSVRKVLCVGCFGGTELYLCIEYHI